ncbi:MAG: RNA polymerase sigma factor [Labedaea sp.]
MAVLVGPGMPNSLEHLDVAALVALARARDQAAWQELVRRYAPLVWRVARAHRLDPADAGDVCQHTWIALAEHIATLRRPDRLAAWLATTARREALRVCAARRREARPQWWPESVEDPRREHWPEQQVLRTARDRLLWRAFSALPDRCRELLGLLAHAPELSYAQLAAALGIKPGSVGSARGRCLHELRRRLAGLGIGAEAAG